MDGVTSQGMRRDSVGKTKTEVRKMELGEIVRVGVLSGIVVAIVSALIIWLRAGNIAEVVATNTNAVGFGSGGSGNVGTWIGLWAGISLVFGVVATWVYDYVAVKWSWGMTQYLALAVGLAVVLTVLAYLKLYGGKANPFATEWLGLNFAFGVGFGYLIPMLAR